MRLARARPGSLNGKFAAILAAVGLAGSVAIAALLVAVITPSFNRLEEGAVDAHVERTRAVLDDVARRVETAVRDYGDWNASYDYMANPTRAFEDESFSTLAMQNLDVSGMAYVGQDGRIRIVRWIDPASGDDAPAMRARLVTAIPALDLPRLLARTNAGNFYLQLGGRLAAVGVAQVRRSDGTGAPRGYVLMARELSSAQLASLLQLPARIDLAAHDGAVAVTPDRQSLNIAVPVLGPTGRPVATTRFAVPRDLSMLGRRMLFLAVAGAVVLIGLMLLVLRGMIARLVLRPLHRVERHMGQVRASGTLAPLAEEARSDEIGNLVDGLNAMLRQLKDLSEQVEMQSYKLGQSESAVAVMHNVRNALNPISTLLSKGIAESGAANPTLVCRAVAELGAEDMPPERRRKLAAFVEAAIAAADAERAERRQGLEIGRAALHNVLEIIGKQQADAHERPPVALVDLSDVVAQNAAIARYSGSQSIAFQFPARPHWAIGNRVMLSQVIGNLLANAGEAIAARGGEGGAITCEVRDAGACVELVIRDNGEGFEPGREPQLFQRGYSTRAHKSGGLGLHWCANAMGAMGGTLRLESDGRGLGARAVLSLPAPEAGEMAA